MLELVKPYKVVISYIPAFLHLHVAKACLAQGIHLVTSSYISPEMKAMVMIF
jgi:saccharopine dehydrogenase-like NADP-dependent oxidoreductase